MKRIFIILLIISFAIVFFGCGKQNSETLKFENTFVTTDENVIMSDVDYDMHWPDFFGDVSPESMYKEAEVVAYGTVGKVEFCDEPAFGLTLYEFTLEKVYKGDLKQGETLVVGADGGDVRMSTEIERNGNGFDLTEEEIAKTVIRYRPFGEEIPKEGEKFLLFISRYKNNPGDGWPEGIYWQFKACASRFFYNEKGELERAAMSRYPTMYWPKNEKGEPVQPATGNNDRWTFEELDAKLTALQKAAE